MELKIHIRTERSDLKPCSVYLIKLHGEGDWWKVGISTHVKKRFSSIQTSSPHRLELIDTLECSCDVDARFLENSLHQRFSANKSQYSKEWFSGCGTAVISWFNHYKQMYKVGYYYIDPKPKPKKKKQLREITRIVQGKKIIVQHKGEVCNGSTF